MAASTLPVAILDYMATGSVLAAMMATGSVLAAILDSKMAARGACALSTVSAWTTTNDDAGLAKPPSAVADISKGPEIWADLPAL